MSVPPSSNAPSLNELITPSLNIYQLLGLASETATSSEIRRAYRQTALKYHPDKNPSDDAAEKFHLLTVASETLLDESLRQVYDGQRMAQMAQKRQLAAMDRERRRMRDDLERREQEAMIGRDIKRSKSSVDVDQLRSEGLRRKGSLQTKMEDRSCLRKMAPVSESQSKEPDSKAPVTIFSETDCTVQVKWRLTSPLGQKLAQDSQELKAFFGKFGEIDQVVVLPINFVDPATTTKKMGSGLIVFKQKSVAYAAVKHNYKTDFTDIAKVIKSVEFTKKPTDVGIDYQESETKPDVADLKASIAAKLAKLKEKSKGNV
ncbi:DnaJ-domain-containing protein [Nadsonia fulvescens var. elongata DSM 6958]|uniref:DnaJ-domain-containing protein n=1 Tax=Nadsonia fulvescens var. elongata DSM 6958 TaxID=857566 RepID=A0A1E3PEF5_9ASCO|nr:DnaJ-domain-containing protein [Nadsonia fulvescens var. elongata DSM 6958]